MNRPVFFALGLLALSGVSTLAPAQAPPGKPTTYTVVIQNHQYVVNGKAQALRIKGGDQVIWVNKDRMGHTATSDPGAPFRFDTKVIRPGASSAPVTFPPGNYTVNYHCEIHPPMRSSIVVGSGSVAKAPRARPRLPVAPRHPH